MRRFLYSALLLAFTSLGVAQETPLEAGLEATYNESVDLFEDGLYAAARVSFDELLESDLPTQSFLKEDLIDDMTITTMPILLGGGAPLFSELPKELKFEHVASEVYLNEIVQDHYKRKRT